MRLNVRTSIRIVEGSLPSKRCAATPARTMAPRAWPYRSYGASHDCRRERLGFQYQHLFRCWCNRTENARFLLSSISRYRLDDWHVKPKSGTKDIGLLIKAKMKLIVYTFKLERLYSSFKEFGSRLIEHKRLRATTTSEAKSGEKRLVVRSKRSKMIAARLCK